VASLASRAKSARTAWTLAVVLAVALVASWLWFLHSLPALQLKQDQLNALAARADGPEARLGRESDAYEDRVVKKAIRGHAQALQTPWLAYLAGKPARSAGAVTLNWTISPDGRSTQVVVASSDFDHAEFNDGVRAAVAAIVFPPPPGGKPVHLTHRLFFKQEVPGN
jgi:TonB family protein